MTSEYTYIGNFKDKLFQGLGTMIFADGSLYYGDFDKGLRHGFGKETAPATEDDIEILNNLGYSSGKYSSNSVKNKLITYHGDFYFGKRHGMAKLEDMDRNCLFHGLFINGSRVHYKLDEDPKESYLKYGEEKKQEYEIKKNQ